MQTCAVWSASLGRAHPLSPDRWTMLSQKWASVPAVLLPWGSIWEALSDGGLSLPFPKPRGSGLRDGGGPLVTGLVHSCLLHRSRQFWPTPLWNVMFPFLFVRSTGIHYPDPAEPVLIHLCQGWPGSSKGTRNSRAWRAERKQYHKEELNWRQEARSLKKWVWSSLEPASSYCTAPREEGITHLQQTLPTCDNPAHFPAPGWQQWFFLAFLPLDPANEGAHGENLFPSSCKCLPRARRGSSSRCCGSPAVRRQPSPPARAGAFPSWVASQQTCCCSWRRSRAAPVCRCYPSLLGQDLASGHTPILEGGSFPPSWRWRGARAAPRQ